MAYNVVKAFVENIEKFKKIHASFGRITVESLVGPGVTVPYHDGAIRYFKEIGLWTPEMDARQAELLQKKE
jgi:TRAP-type uncharacterized transport system substrate-binding protein